MTDAQVRDKFRANAALALGDEDVEALEACVMTLEQQDRLDGLEILSHAAPHFQLAA